MLRESLTNTSETTPSRPRKFSRGIVALVLAGAACLAIGMFGSYGEQAAPIDVEASEAYLTSLTEHHSYFKSQNELFTRLIEEGEQNRFAAIEAYNTLLAPSQNAKSWRDNMKRSVNLRKTDVTWSGNALDQLVRSEELKKAFSGTGQAMSHIKELMGGSYNIFVALRQDVRTHFGRLNAFIDNLRGVILAVQDDAKTSSAELELRQVKNEMGIDIDKQDDAEMWMAIVEQQRKDLKSAVANNALIVEGLGVLQKSASSTQDELEREMLQIKNDIAEESGSAYKEILRSLTAGDNYFSGVAHVSKGLTKVATNQLYDSKKFITRMDFNARIFSDEDLKEELSDELFANDTAEELVEALEELGDVCDDAASICDRRKRDVNYVVKNYLH